MTILRLEGLEPDNLLAFLALLGLLRSLEAVDGDRSAGEQLHPRVAWDLDRSPLRPVLHVAATVSAAQVAELAAAGLARLADAHDFGGRPDPDYPQPEARALLWEAADSANASRRGRADVMAALMTDAAVKDATDSAQAPVEPTPLCLLFGQGHQHFLERFARVVSVTSPPPRGRGRAAIALSAEECLAEALYAPWHRSDPTAAFRWDPEEDVRYALMAGNPTASAYKCGTQHGANRLAAAGLVVLSVVPQRRRGRVRPAIPGGAWNETGFSFAWPVWRDAASLAAVRALLAHPGLRDPGGVSHLGVVHVFSTRRISVGKFMNFSRGRVIT